MIEKQKKEDEKALEPTFEEDWNLSQFWYDDETADTIAKEAMKLANGDNIACVSTPSIFRALKRLYPDNGKYFVFEYDKRFDKFGDQFCFL